MGWVKTEKTNKLSQLGDIDFTTTAQDGQILKYNALNDKWENKDGSIQLSELTDVDLTTTAPVNGNTLVYDETSDVWIPGAGGGGGLEVVELTQAEYDMLSTAEKNNGKMYLVNDTGKVLTGTLAAGSTTLVFNDAAIKSDSMIDVYTTIAGVNPIGINASTGVITLYFRSQAADMGVKVVIM